MVICQQYSGSLERRKGFWEAFHHWLETRDFLVSEFKTRRRGEGKKKKKTSVCARARAPRVSKAHNSVSLFSDLSKTGRRRKKTRHTYPYSGNNRICRLIRKQEIIPVNNAESCDAAAEQRRLDLRRWAFLLEISMRDQIAVTLFVLVLFLFQI